MNSENIDKTTLYTDLCVSKDLIDYAVHKNMEAILGFSMKRTDNRHDAEDLTQDIIIEIYKSYRRIKKYEGHEALEGWMWAIARHTYCNWLNRKKKGNVVYIEGMVNEDLYENLDDSIGNVIVKEEQLNILRREISMLSKTYRDIIVLYYLEEKTCIEISQMTEIPLSTVKWRLHEGKRVIKERMEDMKTYTERTYETGNLWIKSFGTFNKEHSSFYIHDQVKSLLRQNILLCAYRKPMEIKEISFELGVPAVYIEEEIECLLREEFIKERSSGKYQTDFIIVTKDIKEKIYPVIEELACNVGDYLLQILNGLEEEIRKIGFVGCDKPWNEIICTIIPWCLDGWYSILFDKIELKARPYGNSWRIMGFEGKKKDYPYSGGSNRNAYPSYKFSQTIYWTNSFTYRSNFLDEKEVKFYCDLLRKKIILSELQEQEKETVAQLISKGFLIKENGLIKINMTSFTEAQSEYYEKIIKAATIDYFNENILNKSFEFMTIELKKRVPVQLQQDISFAASMLISEMSGYTIKYLIDKKVIDIPKDISASVSGMFVVYDND